MRSSTPRASSRSRSHRMPSRARCAPCWMRAPTATTAGRCCQPRALHQQERVASRGSRVSLPNVVGCTYAGAAVIYPPSHRIHARVTTGLLRGTEVLTHLKSVDGGTLKSCTCCRCLSCRWSATSHGFGSVAKRMRSGTKTWRSVCHEAAGPACRDQRREPWSETRARSAFAYRPGASGYCWVGPEVEIIGDEVRIGEGGISRY